MTHVFSFLNEVLPWLNAAVTNLQSNIRKNVNRWKVLHRTEKNLVLLRRLEMCQSPLDACERSSPRRGRCHRFPLRDLLRLCFRPQVLSVGVGVGREVWAHLTERER